MLSTSSRSARTLKQVLVAALLTLSTTLVAAKDNGAAAEKGKLSVSASAKTKAAPAVKAADAMARVPLAFEANQGQVDKRVEYFSRGAGYTLFLTKDEAVLSLTNAKGQPDVLRVKLTGTDAKSKVSAIERLGWNNNYFIGKDPAKWRTNVPNYRKVEFDNVYPGVSLVYYGNQRQLEHDFVVAPNADAKKIAMEIAGASDLTIDSTGNLVIKTTRGEVRFEKPVIYQDVNGARKDVAGKFILRDKKSVGFEIADYDRSKALIIDPVINFGTLLSASVGVTAAGVAVDGATGNSYVTGVTQATAFPSPAPAAGTTASVGPSDDVYVVKVATDGSSLGYVSFIGSSGNDSATGIALDASNNAFITGVAPCTVANTSTDFPTTANSFQAASSCPGVAVAFVTVLSPTGSALVYSTLYGGSSLNSTTDSNGIAVVGEQAFITGDANSSAPFLPTSPNAFSSSLSGTQDAFLAQIDTSSSSVTGGTCDLAGHDTLTTSAAHAFVVGEQVTISGVVPAGATTYNQVHAVVTSTTATTITYNDGSCAVGGGTGSGGTITGGLVYGSYLGGAGGTSIAQAIVAPAANVVYIGGRTTSATFPTKLPAQALFGGVQDGFIARFDPTQSVAANTVSASTYLGGTASDQVQGLAVDVPGNVYAVGITQSTDFPNTAGGAQAANGGSSDTFVTKLPATLGSITQSTYLGGTGAENSSAISVEPGGAFVWVVGNTTTPTADNIFNVNAIDPSLSGAQDGFIAKFTSNLATKSVATYFGGNNTDTITAIAATGTDTVVVAGNTNSTDFYALGATTGSAYQTVPASVNTAGFVAKFSANSTAIVPNFLSVAPINSTDPLKFDGTNNSDYTITLTNNDAAVPATNTALDLHMDLTKLAINTITPTGMTCVTGQANANSGITCDAGTIAAAGGTASVDVNVSAIPCAGAPTCPATTAVTNISVGSAESGSNATSTITSNILPVADIQVGAITAVSNLSGAGKFVVQKDSSFTYSYTITNAGPNTSGTFDVTNTLPAGFTATTRTIVVATGTATSQTCDAQVAATVTCHVAGLSNGGTLTVTMAGDPTSILAAGTARTTNQLDFSASVAVTGSSYVDSTPGNDTGSVTGSALERVATFTSSVAATSAGSDTAEQKVGTLSWTATATNNGPSTVASMRVVVTVDRGAAPNFTNIASVTPGCAAAVGQTITCTDPNPVASGGTYVVAVTATAPATINGDAAPATQTFTNGVGGVVLTATADTNPATVVSDDTGTAQVQASGAFQAIVERRSDLSVGALTATAGPTSISGSISLDLTAGSSNINYAIPGTTVVYTLTPTNPATSFISGGGVQNGSTTGAACVNTTPAPAGALTYTCTIANLANVGQPIHLVINAPVTDNVSTGTVSTAAFTSSACIAGPVTNASDPGNGCAVGGNNVSTTAAADPSSQIQRQADLDISAVGTGTSFAGGPGTVALAGPLTYTYRIRNNGPDTALNVLSTITETSSAVNTPLIVGAFSGATSCSLNGTNIDCSIASIPATGSVLVTVPITPPLLNSMTLAGGAAKTDTLSAVVALDPQVSTFDTTAGNNSNGTTVSTTLQRTADVNIAGTAFTAARSASVLANTPASTPTNITTNLTSPMSMTFGLTNAGPDTALNVPVKLTNINSSAPSVAISGISSSAGSTCSLSGADIVCTVTTVPTVGTTSITVNFTPPIPSAMALPTASPTGSFTTTAAITAPASYVDGTPGNDTNATTVTTNLQRQSDLQLNTFSTSTPTVDLTQNVNYTIAITNAGPDPALKEMLQLNLNSNPLATHSAFVPAGSTVDVGTGALALAASASNGCITNNSSSTQTQLICEIDNQMAVGGAAGWSVNVSAPKTTAMNTGASSDAVTADGIFSSSNVWDNGTGGNAATPAPGNNASPNTVTVTVQRQSDLAVNSITATPNVNNTPGHAFVVNLDSTINYAVVVQNGGLSDATNVTVTLNLPVGSALSGGQPAGCGAGSAFNAVTGVETCNFGNLAVASGATPLAFVVTPPALAAGAKSTPLTATATIASSAVIDSNHANDSQNTTITQERDVNLTIPTLTSTPNVSGSGKPFVVTKDSTISYALTLNNAGPSDATNVVLTVVLPAGASVPDPGTCTGAGGFSFNAGTATITCNVGTIANGATQAQTFVVTPPALGSVPSTTLLTTAQLSTTSANNASVNSGNSVNTVQERDINLTIPSMTSTPNASGSGNPFVVTKDSTISYALTLNNAGPSDATNVVLTVSLPAGSTVPDPGTCTGAGGFSLSGSTITCNVGTVVNGSSPTQTFVVTPPALAAGTASTLLSASATVTTNPNSANNTGNPNNSVSITQERDADLGVTISVPATTLSVGPGFDSVSNGHQQVTYTIVATNNGPSDATNVKVTDVLPAGFTFTSFTSTLGGVTCSGAGAPVTVTCDFGGTPFLNGSTDTITITATATAASLPAAQTTNVVSNNASIASTTLNDPTPGNNSTTVPALVTLHGEADISISGITATPASGATLHVGDDLIYGVTVHNAGPHPTQLNLAFSDVLPAGVTPVSVTPGSGTTNCVLGATTTCTMTTGLAIGGSETINIRVHVPAAAVGALNSNATVDTPANPVADEEDSALGNNTLGNSTTALAAADLQLTEVAVPNPTLAGTSTTFTVTIANLAPPAYVAGSPVVGGSNATGITVRNVVTVTPASPTIAISSITNNFGATCPASATLTGGTATINCTGGNVTSGASHTITLTTTPSVIGTLTNVATITAANEFDPVSGNNSTTVTDREDNTPVCSGAGCTAITPVDPVSGNSPLSLPQSATVQFTNVTTQGSTTMTVAAQPASCQILDSTSLPAGSTLINNSTHVPFHGILPYTGSRTYACGSGAPLFYNISTTATASGTANVCVNYSGTTFHKADRVRLVEVSGAAAQDITIASGFSATSICGQLPSFTSASGTVTVAVMEPSNAMPDLTAATATPNNSAAARGAAGNAVDLSAAGTFDNDGPDKCVTGTCSDTLTYRWFSTGFLGSSTVLGKTVTVPVSATGTVNILLTATDPYGDSETRLFTLTFTGTLGSGSGSGNSGGFVTSASVNKGQAASFTTALDNPTGGAVSLFVSNAATLASSQIVCTISPNTLPAGSTGTAVTVLCSTQGQIFAKMDAPQRGMGKDEVPMLAGMVGITALPLMGMLLMPGKSRRKKLLKMWAAIGLVLMFTMFQAACGGGGASSFGGAPTLKNAGTPAGTYQVVIASNPAGVTGSSAVTTGTVAGSTTFTLTVQ